MAEGLDEAEMEEVDGETPVATPAATQAATPVRTAESDDPWRVVRRSVGRPRAAGGGVANIDTLVPPQPLAALQPLGVDPTSVDGAVQQVTVYPLLRAVCVAVLLGVFLAVTVLTAKYMRPLSVPSQVDWGNNLANQLVSNVGVMPLSFVYVVQALAALCTLTVPAAAVAAAVATAGTAPAKAAAGDDDAPSSEGEAAEELETLAEEGVAAPPAAFVAKLFFLRQLPNIVLGLTVYSAISWVPALVLNLLLYKSLSHATLSTITTVVNIVLIGLVIRVGSRAYEWWKVKRSKAARKREVKEERRHTVTRRKSEAVVRRASRAAMRAPPAVGAVGGASATDGAPQA
jgi:hypothetical protein